MSYFTYRDEELCAEGVPLHNIAGKFGTPCYVYSRAALEAAYQDYDQALERRGHLICYAVMTEN